ncbi:MAG TPA: cation diffusion facilitator family transporter [Anaerolineae bacterium]
MQVKTSRRLEIALLITALFVLGEGTAGIFSNSLALLSDAAHNFTDALALGLSLYALRLSQRPANPSRTFGYHRAGILAALVNAATLIGVAVLICYEALRRLAAPPAVQEDVIIIVALVAFVMNTLIAFALHQPGKHDLNVRSAFVHMAGDAVSTLGVFAAGIAISITGLVGLDPLASILISAIIIWSSWGILRETADILLEGTPRGIDMDAMLRDLTQIQGVYGIHDLHAWSINSNLRTLSAHVLTGDVSISAGAAIQREINQVLLQRYNIAHTALQLECEGCSPDALYCELGEPVRK